MPKIEIIPAVLPRSLNDLGAHLARIRGVSTKVQIDIVGGGFFTRNRTWPFRDSASFKKIIREESGLPYWTEFDLEFDLMVDNPKELSLQLVGLHASRIIIHARRPGAYAAARLLGGSNEGDTRPPLVDVGIALPADAAIEELDEFEGVYDFVQVMGIAQVGYQGKPLDPRALALIEKLRARFPQTIIQVDGGVKKENAISLVRAGANRLIAGSAIFATKDPEVAYKELYTKVNG